MVDAWQKSQYGEMFKGHQLFEGFSDEAWLFLKRDGTIIRENIAQLACEHFEADTRLVAPEIHRIIPPQRKYGY